ncbi:hypothetical protein MN608_00550 [Microdochium nivale]|nr:hypothetical protein MN608_00550 [Microdochium nivale]
MPRLRWLTRGLPLFATVDQLVPSRRRVLHGITEACVRMCDVTSARLVMVPSVTSVTRAAVLCLHDAILAAAKPISCVARMRQSLPLPSPKAHRPGLELHVSANRERRLREAPREIAKRLAARKGGAGAGAGTGGDSTADASSQVVAAKTAAVITETIRARAPEPATMELHVALPRAGCARRPAARMPAARMRACAWAESSSFEGSPQAGHAIGAYGVPSTDYVVAQHALLAPGVVVGLG